MKKLILLFIIFYIYLPLYANTSRDLGNEPDLNIKLISKWIIFYTNVERLTNGQRPLQYDSELEKAALWQAEYCAKIQKLDHVAVVNGMSKFKDRIEFFGGKCGNCGENLNVKFSANFEGIPVSVKNDSNGVYYDYGNKTVNWFNEQEIGYIMVDSWMKSPGHRKNILGAGFMWIGAGIAKGLYSNNKSFYGCQVFNGYGGLPHSFIKAEYQLTGLEAKKSMINGKDAFIISYSGELVPGIIEVNKNKEIKSYILEKKDNKLVFIKNMSIKGELFLALYEKKQDILYPVMLLK